MTGPLTTYKLGNLAQDVTATDLVRFFGLPLGLSKEDVTVNLIMDLKTKTCSGQGFVTLPPELDRLGLIKDGVELNGRRMNVSRLGEKLDITRLQSILKRSRNSGESQPPQLRSRRYRKRSLSSEVGVKVTERTGEERHGSQDQRDRRIDSPKAAKTEIDAEPRDPRQKSDISSRCGSLEMPPFGKVINRSEDDDEICVIQRASEDFSIEGVTPLREVVEDMEGDETQVESGKPFIEVSTSDTTQTTQVELDTHETLGSGDSVVNKLLGEDSKVSQIIQKVSPDEAGDRLTQSSEAAVAYKLRPISPVECFYSLRNEAKIKSSSVESEPTCIVNESAGDVKPDISVLEQVPPGQDPVIEQKGSKTDQTYTESESDSKCDKLDTNNNLPQISDVKTETLSPETTVQMHFRRPSYPYSVDTPITSPKQMHFARPGSQSPAAGVRSQDDVKVSPSMHFQRPTPEFMRDVKPNLSELDRRIADMTPAVAMETQQSQLSQNSVQTTVPESSASVPLRVHDTFIGKCLASNISLPQSTASSSKISPLMSLHPQVPSETIPSSPSVIQAAPVFYIAKHMETIQSYLPATNTNSYSGHSYYQQQSFHHYHQTPPVYLPLHYPRFTPGYPPYYMPQRSMYQPCHSRFGHPIIPRHPTSPRPPLHPPPAKPQLPPGEPPAKPQLPPGKPPAKPQLPPGKPPAKPQLPPGEPPNTTITASVGWPLHVNEVLSTIPEQVASPILGRGNKSDKKEQYTAVNAVKHSVSPGTAKQDLPTVQSVVTVQADKAPKEVQKLSSSGSGIPEVKSFKTAPTRTSQAQIPDEPIAMATNFPTPSLERPLPTSYNLIDVAAILTHPKFKNGFAERAIERASKCGVSKIIIPGMDLDASRQAAQMSCENAGRVYFLAGVHPHYAASWTPTTVDQLGQLLGQSECVGVGECGLDYCRQFTSREQQIPVFTQQVRLACSLRKPLLVHSRGSLSDVLTILGQYIDELPPTIIHCFSGGREELQACLNMGFYLGLTGSLCRDAVMRRLLSTGAVPLERLLLETDSPFMFPEYNRVEHLEGVTQTTAHSLRYLNSDRNEPSTLAVVCEIVAGCMRISPQEVAQKTSQNAVKFFSFKD